MDAARFICRGLRPDIPPWISIELGGPLVPIDVLRLGRYRSVFCVCVCACVCVRVRVCGCVRVVVLGTAMCVVVLLLFLLLLLLLVAAVCCSGLLWVCYLFCFGCNCFTVTMRSSPHGCGRSLGNGAPLDFARRAADAAAAALAARAREAVPRGCHRAGREGPTCRCAGRGARRVCVCVRARTWCVCIHACVVCAACARPCMRATPQVMRISNAAA